MESVEYSDLKQTLIAMQNTIKILGEAISSASNADYPHRSEQIAELATALSKAQGEFQVAQLNRQNPYFKSRYADLMSVVSSARPALSKHGLSVVQDILSDEHGSNVLHTILLHSTGQYIESRMRIVPPKSDIQTISSYVTYLKRLTYASLVGVVTGEDDDDGEASVAQERATHAKGVANKFDAKEHEYVSVSRDQIDELERELDGHEDIADRMLLAYKIQSIADLPKAKYANAISRIREIKLEMKESK